MKLFDYNHFAFLLLTNAFRVNNAGIDDIYRIYIHNYWLFPADWRSILGDAIAMRQYNALRDTETRLSKSHDKYMCNLRRAGL